MNRAARVLGLVPVVAAILLARPASAQSETATATELFDTGRDLMKQGRYAEACPKLAESARLDAKVGTLARLAECDEAQGHLSDGLAHWRQALDLARAQHDDRAEHVQTEFARIDRIVPKLRFSSTAAAPPGLVVRVDSVAVSAAGFDVAVPVDPGTHSVAASAPGKKPWSSRVETKADGATTSVSIPALDDLSTAAPPPAPALEPDARREEPPASGLGTLRIGAIVTGSAGVVALGIGAGFGLAAKSKLDQSNGPGGCVGDNCPPAAADIRNAGRGDGDVSTILFAAGGGLVVGGITMWLLAPHPAPPQQVTGGISMALAPGITTVGVRGWF